jgi:AhpD family alkylhydroperoxidase
VFAAGALDEKTKQLITVAVAHVTQCPYCIRGHTKATMRKGASEPELMEAIWVAAEMRAGGAYAHSTLTLDTARHTHGPRPAGPPVRARREVVSGAERSAARPRMGQRSGADAPSSRCQSTAAAASMTSRRYTQMQHPARTENAGPTKEVLMHDETKIQGALGQQHVGRFSEGIEQLPDTPNKRRIGRFSAGIERRPQGELRRGRFSEGMEQLPRTPSRLRRGSFANGYDSVR